MLSSLSHSFVLLGTLVAATQISYAADSSSLKPLMLLPEQTFTRGSKKITTHPKLITSDELNKFMSGNNTSEANLFSPGLYCQIVLTEETSASSNRRSSKKAQKTLGSFLAVCGHAIDYAPDKKSAKLALTCDTQTCTHTDGLERELIEHITTSWVLDAPIETCREIQALQEANLLTLLESQATNALAGVILATTEAARAMLTLCHLAKPYVHKAVSVTHDVAAPYARNAYEFTANTLFPAIGEGLASFVNRAIQLTQNEPTASASAEDSANEELGLAAAEAN